jgi:hypothetical protein
MTPALVALIVLMLWPVPAVEAEPFVYVVGGPLGSRGIQVLTDHRRCDQRKGRQHPAR